MKVIYFVEKNGKERRVSLSECAKLTGNSLQNLKPRLIEGEIIATTDGGKIWAEEL